MLICPLFTSATRLSKSARQLSGAMYMSRPAFMACGQSVVVQPGIWPWAFQSSTTKPLKPIRPLSTPVIRLSFPEFLTPFQLENEVMTVSTPASIAGG